MSALGCQSALEFQLSGRAPGAPDAASARFSKNRQQDVEEVSQDRCNVRTFSNGFIARNPLRYEKVQPFVLWELRNEDRKVIDSEGAILGAGRVDKVLFRCGHSPVEGEVICVLIRLRQHGIGGT